jgi:Formyl transferase
MSGGRSLVVFADSASPESVALLDLTLRRAASRTDVSVVAVCDARRKRPESHFLAAGRALAAPLVTRFFDSARRPVVRRTMVASLGHLARRKRVPLLVPPARDVNHPEFVALLRDELGGPLGLSLLVAQIFRPLLLAGLECAVNFHPGRLPAYRGLAPTAWEVYRQERHAGLSFHVMTPGIDEGPLLVASAIPIAARVTVEDLQWRKIERADALLDEVFDALVGGAPGIEQRGEACYYGRAELRAVRAVGDPSALTWAELELRLRAFGALAIGLADNVYWVTKLRRLDPGGARASRYTFTTLDGVRAEATRFRNLPLPLARLFRRKYLANTGARGG